MTPDEHSAWNVWRKVLPHFAWTCFENLAPVSIRSGWGFFFGGPGGALGNHRGPLARA